MTDTTKEHLVIIIDNAEKIEPKKYSCPFGDKSKQEAISASKGMYEQKYNNFDYRAYYFQH